MSELVRHPDSTIRLTSAVHRFKVPRIHPDQKVSFVSSFRTVGSAGKTKNTMQKADEARQSLFEGLCVKKISNKRVVDDAQKYVPLIQQISISCKAQNKMARMDKPLVFQWTSGIEKEEMMTVYQSESLMYDSVMAIACNGLGRAGLAADQSAEGDFVAASRDYAAAAGTFKFLGNDQLPKWSKKGSAQEELLPLECSQSVALALCQLFAANGQQMAIATVLTKPGIPNYSLLAKLCLGVHDQLNQFFDIMRKNCFALMDKIDQDFYTLLSFQIPLQKAMSLYFQARALWDKNDFGNAIALLSEALKELQAKTTASRYANSNKKGKGGGKNTAVASSYSSEEAGIPDISRKRNDSGTFKSLHADLKDFRKHAIMLLQSWESENSNLFFDIVPNIIPIENRLQEGLLINHLQTYELPEDIKPLLLELPKNKVLKWISKRALTQASN